jgi:hypothetical protein
MELPREREKQEDGKAPFYKNHTDQHSSLYTFGIHLLSLLLHTILSCVLAQFLLRARDIFEELK